MKDQWKTYLMIGLIGIGIETLTGFRPLFAQEMPTTFDEETSVISVEDVAPLETPTGTPQDLGAIEGKDSNQWGWEVGGESPTNTAISESNSVYQVNDKSQVDTPETDWQQENRAWQSDNRGDYNSPSSKIPFAHF
ncbi:hypothetical protein PCC7424_4693 [Gloeothece citriformis PCC 7424]|uniref:Uncharacterized protein n=1 Tax=Gloeothece citriformis (strain PCC 7424) TaxID=65393 RepID=B7KBS5_GLOC7|nr:hypothetical protein [Gloeothece citriformis]ACK73053.1 hypothetical protein PCC7424_4693 [Gloeothece citriformis PCC 7424]